ncbi:uncharacterized protein LOC123365744 [Mauremys mutica]|uniref:uncharacterized protein LOC123365744 n=1 Tax=Mauremys mutica TaxID=74926 RepID=UPI001D1626DB|nr:uncharacterized protein LOC123365744 [Mauremys mutica]
MPSSPWARRRTPPKKSRICIGSCQTSWMPCQGTCWQSPQAPTGSTTSWRICIGSCQTSWMPCWGIFWQSPQMPTGSTTSWSTMTPALEPEVETHLLRAALHAVFTLGMQKDTTQEVQDLHRIVPDLLDAMLGNLLAESPDTNRLHYILKAGKPRQSWDLFTLQVCSAFVSC